MAEAVAEAVAVGRENKATGYMNTYILTTERLGLRRWIESDTEPFAKMNQDPDVMKYFPKTLTGDETKEMLQRINQHFDKFGFGLFAVENKLTEEFIGFTGFYIPAFESFFTPCIEIGWRYKKAAWGQGFAKEAATACLQYGFDILQFKRVVSFTSPLNKNSEKVMQRIGMKYITDFDHPQIDQMNKLKRHVLYQIDKD
jgi:[ribosomal protein S5]-alanine N-acetyltransferase